MVTVVKQAFVTSGISICAARTILLALRKLHPELPSDPRTLLGTPRCTIKHAVGNGRYIHFGLDNGLQRVLEESSFDADTISLQLHVDGMTVFRGSNQQLWPILGRTIEPRSPVFIIGLYCGMSKPTDISAFLCDVIE